MNTTYPALSEIIVLSTATLVYTFIEPAVRLAYVSSVSRLLLPVLFIAIVILPASPGATPKALVLLKPIEDITAPL